MVSAMSTSYDISKRIVKTAGMSGPGNDNPVVRDEPRKETFHSRRDGSISGGSDPGIRRKVPRADSQRTGGEQKTKHRYARDDEKKLLNRMEKYMENHLLFLHDFEVPFDDNMSERDLRKAKNRQKIAGGFRKESGHEMYCNILTIIETLKRRNMVLLENIKKLFMGTPAIF